MTTITPKMRLSHPPKSSIQQFKDIKNNEKNYKKLLSPHFYSKTYSSFVFLSLSQKKENYAI